MKTSPSLWQPESYAELIGPAFGVGEVIAGKIARMKSEGSIAMRSLFHGEPGTGKSALAQLAALDLAGGEHLLLERISGISGSLFAVGSFQVKLIEELDRVPDAAQILLLDYLDRTRAFPDVALIGTSNADVDKLQERFQTRLQYWPVEKPKADEIEKLLLRWNPNPGVARMIAETCCGNVRQAMLDLEGHLDVEYVRRRKAA